MDNYHASEIAKTLRSIDDSLKEIVEQLGLIATPKEPS